MVLPEPSTHVHNEIVPSNPRFVQDLIGIHTMSPSFRSYELKVRSSTFSAQERCKQQCIWHTSKSNFGDTIEVVYIPCKLINGVRISL